MAKSSVYSKSKPKAARVVMEMPEHDLQAFDQWAAGKGFESRAEAVRSVMTEAVQREAA